MDPVKNGCLCKIFGLPAAKDRRLKKNSFQVLSLWVTNNAIFQWKELTEAHS
jgi:hypothetical protein